MLPPLSLDNDSFENLIEGGDTEKKQNSGGWFNEKV